MRKRNDCPDERMKNVKFVPCNACLAEKDMTIGRIMNDLRTANPTWTRLRLESRAKIEYCKRLRT